MDLLFAVCNVHDSRPFGKSWPCFETCKKGCSHGLSSAHEDQGGIGKPEAAVPFISQTSKGNWCFPSDENWFYLNTDYEGYGYRAITPVTETKIVSSPKVLFAIVRLSKEFALIEVPAKGQNLICYISHRPL
jgi:hypothetical protein